MKRQDMFPGILALCFVLKIFRCSEVDFRFCELVKLRLHLLLLSVAI